MTAVVPSYACDLHPVQAQDAPLATNEDLAIGCGHHAPVVFGERVSPSPLSQRGPALQLKYRQVLAPGEARKPPWGRSPPRNWCPRGEAPKGLGSAEVPRPPGDTSTGVCPKAKYYKVAGLNSGGAYSNRGQTNEFEHSTSNPFRAKELLNVYNLYLFRAIERLAI